jgi:hypothetical protein
VRQQAAVRSVEAVQLYPALVVAGRLFLVVVVHRR